MEDPTLDNPNPKQQFIDYLLALHVNGLSPEVARALYKRVNDNPGPFNTVCRACGWGIGAEQTRRTTTTGGGQP